MKERSSSGLYILLELPALILTAALFLVPLAFTFSAALSDGGAPLLAVLSSRATYRVLLFTLEESLISAVCSVLLALPFAAFFGSNRFPGRSALITLSELSFTIPTILVVLGFVIWYGNNGYLNALIERLTGQERVVRLLYSFRAIIAAHVYLNFPIAFALITSAWEHLPATEENASYLLGKGALSTFFRVTLPRLSGTVASSFILIFLYCFSSFTIIMVLGGNPSYSTLEAEIYRRVHISSDMEGGAALSLFTFCVTAFLLLVTSPGRRAQRAVRRRRMLRRARGGRLALAATLSGILLLFLLPPMLSIVYRSFFPRGGVFSLDAWRSVFGTAFGAMEIAPKALASSFAIALFSSVLSTLIASFSCLASARRGSLLTPFLASLPQAAGSVTLGLGFMFIAAQLRLSSDFMTYVFVTASHIIITLPMTCRVLLPGARRVPPALSAASYALGTGPCRTVFRVELPLLAPYMRKAFAFSFALSLGEVNATLMLSSGDVTTLPVLIYRLINTYNYQGAAALGTILLLVAAAGFALGEAGGKNGDT